jgi:hypothetical protein
MSADNRVVSYPFTLAEVKALCALFCTGRVPETLGGFSKTMFDTLAKHISLEEAENLFNEQKRA